MLTSPSDTIPVDIKQIRNNRHYRTDRTESRQCIRDTELGVSQITRDSHPAGS